MDARTSHTQDGHLIVLGGIGGDSHSVGLTILRHALAMNGYRVHYLGIQNRLADFFHAAAFCNAVMISTLDGHARHYLRDFPELMARHRRNGAYRPVWYLGGNLHIGDAHGFEEHFLEMGFKRVFVKFADIRTVLRTLKDDLAQVEPIVDYTQSSDGTLATGNLAYLGAQPAYFSSGLQLMNASSIESLQPATPVSDDRFDPGEFRRLRRPVLEQWKTGHAARNLRANAEFLRRQPSFPNVQAVVNARRAPILIQPRTGVAVLREQIKLFHAFKRAGARALSYQVDSLTRNNNYAGVEEAIRESRAAGLSLVNGFPVINHGVAGLRRVMAEVGAPLQTRHSTRDPRLLAEISYAGGVTSYEGGPICYNIPYYKDYPPAESIRNWQYVDRLTGLYYERFGITLDREFFGTLTATLIPPCLAIAVDIIEAVLAVQQGVKCVTLGYAEQGHRVQDVAAIRALRQLAAETIQNLGHRNVQINAVFHQYMAAFPEDVRRAESLIYHSAITAALSGATRVLTKTPVEAYRIPLLDDNVRGIRLALAGITQAPKETVDEVQVAEECAVICREVRAILDSVILCGHGNLAAGVVAGFQKGYLDIPFSPSIYNRGEVMTARDREGAVRFLSTGNLQFDAELREFHRDKMQERLKAEGLLSEKQSYLLVERDVLQVARGEYDGWPLFK